jgi:hypothetical protein
MAWWRMRTTQKARNTYQIENRVCFSMGAILPRGALPLEGVGQGLFS